MFLLWEIPNTCHDDVSHFIQLRNHIAAHHNPQSFLKITFTTERLRCSLRFQIEEEFWRLLKLLVDTKLANVARRQEMQALLRQSLGFIPVVAGDVKMTDL